jgi:hypothetical protein
MTKWKGLLKASLALGLWFCFWASNSLAQETTFSDGTTGTVDTSIIYGLPGDSDYLEEDITYFDPLLDNSMTYSAWHRGYIGEWSATSGCLDWSSANQGDGSWAGISGGNCANIGINGDGAIRFGYTAATISQTQDVIADALRNVGIDVVGYLYQWKVKNYNANDRSTNQMANQDPLTVTITFKDTAGNELYSKEYDYSYEIASWQLKSGQQLFPQAFGTDATGVDTVTIEVYGQDAGYWAGWWGPEFREGQIYGLYVYRPPEEDNSCDLDPLSSPTCPGYADALAAEQDALLEMIAQSTTADPAGTTDDQAFLQSVQETSTASLDDGSGALEEIISDPITQTQTQTVEPVQTQESTQVAAASDPTPSEAVAEETTAAVEEVAAVEEATEEVAQEESSASNAPSANPLSVAAAAVAAADNVAGAASSGAVANSQASVAAAEQSSADIQSDITEQSVANLEQTATATAVVAGSSTEATSTSNSVASNSSTNTTGLGSTGSQDFGSQSMGGGDDDSSTTGSQAVAMGTTTDTTTEATGLPSSFGEAGTMNVVISSTPGQSNDPGDTGGLAIELVVDSNFDIAAVDSAINLALARVQDLETSIVENAIEESTESFEDQNAKEDALVAEAMAGTDNEDANAALMGYNPNFRAYQTDGLADGAFYAPKEIYEGQQNYDNPNARLFNGASDQLHRDMVRSQYE